MKDITDLSVINKLEKDFVKQFRYAFVFNQRKSGLRSAIIITKNDTVYVCGDNTYGCLGLGHNNAVEVATKLDELCDKHVTHINIIDCESLLYAQTIDGKLYFWGINFNSNKLLGYEKDVCFKPTLMESMADKQVIDVRYSDEYWLALTMNGEVYEWRSNIDCEDLFVPQLVFALKFHTIIAISSGFDHLLALADNGEVFAWGNNEFGQCGCDTSDDHFDHPFKVEGFADNVIKISCGRNHSMVLNESGDIYAFGRNNCGQLGNNTRDTKFIATKITTSVKFVDIATLQFDSDMSISLSNDSLCYIWGFYGERVIVKPTKTQFKSIEDVIRDYKYHSMTFNELYFKKKFDKFTPYDSLVQSFNNQELSDVCFKIDGKYIYALKSYLKTVCKHFSVMFATNVWLESNSKEIEITQYSYPVYYSFLNYLYTDSVDIQSKHLIELYYLADSYFEGNLKESCVELILHNTNVNNVYTFYSFAVHNNLEKLEKYLYDYIIDYISDVMRTEAYAKSNDNSVLKKFVNTSIINGKFTINSSF